MIYVLAYPTFANDIAVSIEQFRLANEPDRARLVRAHVTLVFGTFHAEPDEFGRFCRDVAARHSAISIAFEQAELMFDPFEKVHKICMLCSDGQEDLISLHRELSGRAYRSTPTYRPHMTVATNESSASLSQLDLGVIGEFPIRGEIDSINLVDLGASSLRNLETIELPQ